MLGLMHNINMYTELLWVVQTLSQQNGYQQCLSHVLYLPLKSSILTLKDSLKSYHHSGKEVKYV